MNPKTLQTEQRLEKPARPVTGTNYDPFGSILTIVNDCHREHSVMVAQVTHKRHVMGCFLFY